MFLDSKSGNERMSLRSKFMEDFEAIAGSAAAELLGELFEMVSSRGIDPGITGRWSRIFRSSDVDQVIDLD